MRLTNVNDDQADAIRPIFPLRRDDAAPSQTRSRLRRTRAFGLTTISGVSLTGVVPADKAAWDGARVKLRWAYSACRRPAGSAEGLAAR